MIHDLFFAGIIGALFTLALRQPFLFVLAYMYIDLVAPQHLTYALLDPVPLSLISFVLAVLGWLIFDDKRHAVLGPRQALILALVVYCATTLQGADFPADALRKWDWVWKALVFAMFLPLTLTSRLRIEAAAVILVLSASVIIVPAGIKTLASGGGYGSLRLLLDTNTGLYESSILSCAAIATIPIALFLMRAGTIFPPDWRVRLFCGALCFACLLIPVGTEARTGLICLGVLVFSLLRFVRHRMVWLSALSALTLAALPLYRKVFWTGCRRSPRPTQINRPQPGSPCGAGRWIMLPCTPLVAALKPIAATAFALKRPPAPNGTQMPRAQQARMNRRSLWKRHAPITVLISKCWANRAGRA